MVFETFYWDYFVQNNKLSCLNHQGYKLSPGVSRILSKMVISESHLGAELQWIDGNQR